MTILSLFSLGKLTDRQSTERSLIWSKKKKKKVHCIPKDQVQTETDAEEEEERRKGKRQKCAFSVPLSSTLKDK